MTRGRDLGHHMLGSVPAARAGTPPVSGGDHGAKARPGGAPTLSDLALVVQRASWAPAADLAAAGAAAARRGALVRRRRADVIVVVGRGCGRSSAANLAAAVAAAASGVVIGVSGPGHGSVDAAAREAGLAAALAHCCPTTPTTLADCPGERALSSDLVALREAVDRLRPLLDHPSLTATLEAYFVHDGDRAAAAAALQVQVRALDHRLRRVEELTGLSARRVHESRLIVAGLTSRRVLDWRLAEPGSRTHVPGATERAGK